jgi:hypothetical protein
LGDEFAESRRLMRLMQLIRKGLIVEEGTFASALPVVLVMKRGPTHRRTSRAGTRKENPL